MQITSVAILANTTAGKGSSAQTAMWLAKQLDDRNIAYTIFSSNWPADLEPFSDIWLIGGDGTVNYFINHYPDCNKPIALFKGGTGNDFAWKLYGDQTLEQHFEQVINATPKRIDAGKFNDTLFINCIGVGFDGEIVRSMKTIRLLGGHFGYLLAVIVKIFSFKEHHFTISAGNQKWEAPFLLVMAVNSSRAGGGFTIAPDAKIDDGKLDLVLCKKLSILKRLKYLPIIKKGQHMHLPFVIHTMGTSFTISAGKQMDIQTDGDLYTAKDLRIEVMSGQFLFRY